MNGKNNSKDAPKVHKTELVNSRRSKGSGYSHFRTSYYTAISFKYEGVGNEIEFKIDTGSPHTILGTECEGICEKLVKYHNNDKTKSEYVENVSGESVTIKPCIVDELSLTEDIIIPKIKIFISGDIHKKAVLGMDILSLFDFHYVRKDKTIYLCYTDHYIQDLFSQMVNNDLNYLDPDLIADVDSIKTDNK